MAAYAATVTSTLRKVSRLGDSTGVSIYGGKVDITNYNTTLAEITDITGKFKTIISIVAGTTDNGFTLQWATNSFKAYYADYDAVADGALIEVATDVDVGEADFIVIGLI